jgi:hypothetical protein
MWLGVHGLYMYVDHYGGEINTMVNTPYGGWIRLVGLLSPSRCLLR